MMPTAPSTACCTPSERPRIPSRSGRSQTIAALARTLKIGRAKSKWMTDDTEELRHELARYKRPAGKLAAQEIAHLKAKFECIELQQKQAR
jgi:hypothetical protein